MGSPTVPIYRSTGKLVHAIEERENVVLAQKYLQDDEMAKYLGPPLNDAVARLTWHLDSNGLDYYVEAICNRELTDVELKQLGSEVSGQNSDGLGEGFEQQEFAEWGNWDPEDEDDDTGNGMCSFDWESNDSVFVRVN